MKRQLSSQDVKTVIFEIFCSFADYCDEHHLRYYMCGGTLLGAVRHKGFIPWDDDIDLIMPRPDYDKLHQLMIESPISEQYKLVSITAGNSFSPFAKIVNTKTSLDSKYFVNEKHLWIDIFPMDGLPENQEESDNHLKKANQLKRSFSRSEAKIGAGKGGFRSIVKIPLLLFTKMVGPKRYGSRIDRLARKYKFDSSRFIGGVTWSLGPKERMEKGFFVPATDLEFCGKMFHAPGCWEYYLTSIYGDYMQLPPAHKRVNHELVAYIDD